MPVQLSQDQHDEIFRIIQNAFSDFTLFDKLVTKQLKKVISDTNSVEIDQKTTRKVTERYFDTDQFQTEPQKLLLEQIKIILKTTYVLILSYHPDSEALKFHSVDELLEHYPQFDKEDPEELAYLLKFRNYLKIALQIVPARLNKQLLVKIAARLEGSGNEYITGGGQKPAVTRRCAIYETEGNVTRVSKPKNQNNVKTTVMNQQAQILGNIPMPLVPTPKPVKKRPNTHASLRDVKMIRLPSDEVRRLAQGPQDPFAKAQNQLEGNNLGGVDEDDDGQSYPSKKSKYLSSDNNSVGNSSAYSKHSYPSATSQHSNIGSQPPQYPPLAGNNNIPMGYIPSTETFSSTVIENLDDLLDLELCKTDTVIDNLPQPPLIPIVQHPNPPLPPHLVSGQLGPLSLQSTFPPNLQRQHSDLLDRLLSDGNPIWSEIEAAQQIQPDHDPSQPISTELSTVPAPHSVSVPVIDDTLELSRPVEMIRSVSWDVYNGSFTEDLMQYLSAAPITQNSHPF